MAANVDELRAVSSGESDYLRANNKLASFLLNKCGSPKKVAAFVLALNLIGIAALALTFNSWGEFQVSPTVTGPGYLGEPGSWALDLVAQPVLMGLFVWLSYAGNNLIDEMICDGSLRPSDKVRTILEKQTTSINLPIATGIALLIAISVQGIVTAAIVGVFGEPTNTWQNAHGVIVFFRSVIGVLVFFATAMSIYFLWTILATLGQLMATDRIVLKPFYPDNSAGLGEIGQFSADLGYAVFALAFVILGMYWQALMEPVAVDAVWLFFAVVATLVYLIAAVGFFFFPLNSAHKAMLKYKMGVLEELSTEIDDIYRKLLERPRTQDADKLAVEMNKLRQLHDLVRGFPEWPFHYSAVRRYFALVLSPFMTVLLGFLIEYFASLI